MTIIERIQRPNRQPLVQESRSKLAKQRDPNLYSINANQGRGPIERERRPVHGTGIVLVLLLGLSIGLPFLLHACTRVV